MHPKICKSSTSSLHISYLYKDFFCLFLRNLNLEEVVGAIRQAVAEEHIVEVYAISLLKTGSIAKTTSGKIQRRLCRSQFLGGTLNSVGNWKL